MAVCMTAEWEDISTCLLYINLHFALISFLLQKLESETSARRLKPTKQLFCTE